MLEMLQLEVEMEKEDSQAAVVSKCHPKRLNMDSRAAASEA